MIHSHISSNVNVCLHRHQGRAHRIAMMKENPNSFFSCGEDGECYLYDLRSDNEPFLVTTFQSPLSTSKVPIYVIGVNPMCPYQVALGGEAYMIRIYDARFISSNVICELYPNHLKNKKCSVTGLKYNDRGDSIILSYNDEDIYSMNLVDHNKIHYHSFSSESATILPSQNSSAEAIERAEKHQDYSMKYVGHRNKETIKQVSYFGYRCEYVMSGSDCGHIFLWEARTGQVVKVLKADSSGAINCLTAHPYDYMFGSAGLSCNAKLWSPQPFNSSLKKRCIFDDESLIDDVYDSDSSSDSSSDSRSEDNNESGGADSSNHNADGSCNNSNVDYDSPAEDNLESDFDSDLSDSSGRYESYEQTYGNRVVLDNAKQRRRMHILHSSGRRIRSLMQVVSWAEQLGFSIPSYEHVDAAMACGEVDMLTATVTENSEHSPSSGDNLDCETETKSEGDSHAKNYEESNRCDDSSSDDSNSNEENGDGDGQDTHGRRVRRRSDRESALDLFYRDTNNALSQFFASLNSYGAESVVWGEESENDESDNSSDDFDGDSHGGSGRESSEFREQENEDIEDGNGR